MALLEQEEKMNRKITEYFKDNGLPAPVTIKEVGPWARGTCYAVTCGLLFLKRYCVYTRDGKITSVRRR